jgi:hypothetical protein
MFLRLMGRIPDLKQSLQAMANTAIVPITNGIAFIDQKLFTSTC